MPSILCKLFILFISPVHFWGPWLITKPLSPTDFNKGSKYSTTNN